MSSNFARGWIALGMLVATPLTGLAQRGGDEVDSYSESNYGDARQEAEAPRLFHGGLMHQLRSVTESVWGEDEEKQPASEPNRNIPKPPPLNAQNQRSASNGGTPTREGSRGEQQTAGTPNRTWAGQFLVPNYRNRSQAPARGQSASSDRSSERRVYLGQHSSPPTRTTSSKSDSNSAAHQHSSPRASSPGHKAESGEPSAYSADVAIAARRVAPEPTDATVSTNEAADEHDEGPAEVVVSHVPDVPYVPRKPLPKRDQKSSSTSAHSGHANDHAASSAAPASQPHTNSNSGLAFDSSDAAPKPSVGSQSASSPSPSVPSLEVASMPGEAHAAPTHETADIDPATVPDLRAPSLPSASLPGPSESGSSLPSLSLPSSDSPSLGLPQSSSLESPDAGSDVPHSNSPTANRSTPSLSTPGLPAPSLPAPSLPAPSFPAQPLPSQSLPAHGLLDAPSTPARAVTQADSPAAPVASPAAAPSAGGQERMRMEIPHVIVKLLGPGDLATGTPTSYELVVQNADRIALSGLILRMETPPGVEIVKNPKWGEAVEVEKAADGATLLMWNVAQVAAGGSMQLGLDLKATAARNFAVAIEWTVLPQEGIDELSVKQPDLQVALEGPVDVEKDVANIYRVRVSNPGNAPAHNVKVQVSAAAQQASQVEIGDLAAGQSEVVEMDLTFEKAGRLEIGAHALADGSLKRDTNIVVIVRQPVLQASLSLPKSVLLGGNVFATMELRNTGDGPARRIQAGLMIPAGAEVINPPSGVSRQGDKLLWDVDIVSPGQLVTVPIELRLPSAGSHELKFACVTPSGALTTAEAATTVEAFADLKLQVNDPPAPAPIGTPVVYELTVTNRGSRDARNVTILAQFSEGIEPKSATGSKNRVVPGQVLFDPIPKIAAGESVKIKLTATASEPGMHRFRAEVRCEESDARLVEEESTRFLGSASRIASPPSTLIHR